eukprot:scaffold1650_cov351-Prasinococcus_capsulatus_cf.AAC.16
MLDGFHCLAALGQGALLVVQCIELHRGALVVGAQRGLQLFRQHRHRAPTEHSGGLLVARRRGGGRALAAVVAVAMVAVDGRCKRHALLATWRGGVGVDGVARGPDGHSDRNVLLLLRVAGVGGLLRGLLMVVGGVAVRRVLRVMRGGLRVAQRRRRMRRPLTRPAAVQRRLLPADNAERVHQVCQVGLAPCRVVAHDTPEQPSASASASGKAQGRDAHATPRTNPRRPNRTCSQVVGARKTYLTTHGGTACCTCPSRRHLQRQIVAHLPPPHCPSSAQPTPQCPDSGTSRSAELAVRGQAEEQRCGWRATNAAATGRPVRGNVARHARSGGTWARCPLAASTRGTPASAASTTFQTPASERRLRAMNTMQPLAPSAAAARTWTSSRICLRTLERRLDG